VSEKYQNGRKPGKHLQRTVESPTLKSIKLDWRHIFAWHCKCFLIQVQMQ